MAKSPEPWWRESKGAYYAQVGGRQRRLGVDRPTAYRRLAELLTGDPKPEAPKPVTPVTVAEAAAKHVAALRRHSKKNSVRVAKFFLDSFVSSYGNLSICDVTADTVDEWTASHGTWSRSTVNAAVTRIGAMLRGAGGRLQGAYHPAVESRGARSLVGSEVFAKLRDAASPALRDVLTALHETGARPGEIVRVTAADFDPAAGVWILRDHKADKLGRARIVYLTPAVVELCTRLATTHPTGPLFRTATGIRWTTGNLYQRLAKLAERLGIDVMPYSFRHDFATRALVAGVPDSHVAELLGHLGTKQLHKHYSHLSARAAALRESLGRLK
jgi:integrase